MMLTFHIPTRYCCSVAVYFCFGTTHFCTPCHDDFVRLRSLSKDSLPQCPVGPKSTQLEGTCPLGLDDHPATGEEFALGCGVCRNVQTFWDLKHKESFSETHRNSVTKMRGWDIPRSEVATTNQRYVCVGRHVRICRWTFRQGFSYKFNWYHRLSYVCVT